MAELLELGNVRIGFRNFEGREGQYNRAGERSFVVFLDDRNPQNPTAEELAAAGWNVKFPKDNPGRVDQDEPSRDPYLQVAVTFNQFPPKVILKSGENLSRLGVDEVAMLDWAELENVDLVLRPYEWSVNRNSGIKAYLKSGYFTIVTDAFAAKYGL